MGNDLTAICSKCRRIRIENNTWIDETHPAYAILSKRPGLTDGYCPECIEFYREQWKELKKMYQK